MKIKIVQNKKIKGFTLGLALIIVATTLLISVSISTLLLRDIKNSSSNILNSIAYNLAESGLDCVSSYEDNIRYFDESGENITGIFPKASPYVYLEANTSPITAGYAGKDYTLLNAEGKNKTFDIDQIKCFGYKILDNNLDGTLDSDGSYTKLSATNSTAPTGYFQSSGNTGVVTEIHIEKDITNPSESFFQKYLKNACLNIKIYSVFDNNIYKKLILSESSVPCTGNYVTKRLLVKYLQ